LRGAASGHFVDPIVARPERSTFLPYSEHFVDRSRGEAIRSTKCTRPPTSAGG